MRRYVGVVTKAACQVSIYEGEARLRALSPRCDLVNHSPTGFAWGYGGSGPAQLALAILADHFGRAGEARALRLYQDFKWAYVARLVQDEGFQIRADEIDEFVQRMESGRP